MSKRIHISVEVINKILSILSMLPYQQVAGVIEEIKKDAKPIESNFNEGIKFTK
jgi:hypothetical protein